MPAGTDLDAVGVEGNARLTGATGALLLLLLFAEGVTILAIRQLIGVHIFVGLLLVPPVLLKTGSTGYRFLRYYRGHRPYVRKGPPSLVMRVTGPLVVVSTVLVLASGIALLAVTPGAPGRLVAAHKVSFALWFAVMTVHVLGHLAETGRLAARDWRRGGDRPGRALRRLLVAGSLAAGVGLAAAVFPAASPWTSGQFRHSVHDQGR
ncbi:MAG TPA: hypothetical protein VNG13_03705 [Mycobacteriales bacterium]|nr:hypothetical protein [Mycobacteriales bacterium]